MTIWAPTLSLDLAELMSMLEEEYGFLVTDEDVHSLRTVEDVEEYVREHAPGM